jgi:MFS family permease
VKTNAHAAPAGPPDTGHGAVSGVYKWSVFALTFGLMLSDYLSRNVISAVFPILKTEWSLSDTQLGSLVSVVALIVGFGAFPIALIADRWGRVKSITVMAGVWSLATIGCGMSTGFVQMVVARSLVGLGEAGYGGAGAAILAHVFPPHQRAAVLGAFLAASLFGSVLGVGLGGVIAAHYGWRTAFIAIGASGLVLVVLYPLVVRDYKTVALVKRGAATDGSNHAMSFGEMLRELFIARTAVFAYIASGLQMFIVGAISAWMPSYFARAYNLAPGEAAVQAAVVVLVAGVGMIFAGWLVDRASARNSRNRLRLPAAYALFTFVVLTIAFALPPGDLQRVLILVGALFMGGHSGAVGAVITDVTHPGLRATAFAVAVLGNNLLGLAPGPFVVGVLSDLTSLKTALTLAPATCVLAAGAFMLAAKYYDDDRGRFDEPATTPTAVRRSPCIDRDRESRLVRISDSHVQGVINEAERTMMRYSWPLASVCIRHVRAATESSDCCCRPNLILLWRHSFYTV